MSRNTVRLSVVLLSCLTLFSCDGSTHPGATGLGLEAPFLNRQVMALDDSALRADIVVNSGAVQSVYFQPGQNTIETVITGVRRNETNTIAVTWYEILNGFQVEISEQSQTFVADNSITIDAPHITDQFDYDNDGRSNLDERNGMFCVWSADESCLEPGRTDVPGDQTEGGVSIDPAQTDRDNLLLNGDFSNGTSPYFSHNVENLRVTGGALCLEVPPLPDDPQLDILAYLTRINLEPGSYSIEFEARSSHAGRLLNVAFYQASSNTDLLYTYVEPTTLEWQSKQALYLQNDEVPLEGVSLVIRAVFDESETITYCFDNLALYKQ